jgi:hypothetical protein
VPPASQQARAWRNLPSQAQSLKDLGHLVQSEPADHHSNKGVRLPAPARHHATLSKGRQRIPQISSHQHPRTLRQGGLAGFGEKPPQISVKIPPRFHCSRGCPRWLFLPSIFLPSIFPDTHLVRLARETPPCALPARRCQFAPLARPASSPPPLPRPSV